MTGQLEQELGTSPDTCWIGGAWEAGESDVFDVRDPFTESVIASVVGSSVRQADRAVEAARTSFDSGSWSRLQPRLRSARLHALADLFESQAELFGELLVSEIGSPVSLVRGQQVDNASQLLRWFADAALRGPRQGYEESMPAHLTPRPSQSVLRAEATGVVAAITAYNFPLLLLIRKLGGALAAGCSTIVMPSPRAPLSTIAFMRLVEQVDIPSGVVNLVVGGPDIGMSLTTSRLVDMVTFTGSRHVGQMVMEQSAATVKRVVLELGGKSANIVLPGFDLDVAVKPSLLRFSLNAGQACGATTRAFVHRQDYDAYVDEAQKVMQALQVGDPRDVLTQVGPVISERHRDHVNGYVERARGEGAVVHASAESSATSGFFVEPSLVGHTSNTSEIATDELFGPVGVLIPYSTVDEAIAMANESRFGLNANIWGPFETALEVAGAVRSGTVTINGGGGGRQDVPWGGYGESGIGRESGEAGFGEFFETKHIQWPLA